jgi:hypothetical protein
MAKDNSFILGLETLVPQVDMSDNTPFSNSIDVSAYVDIADGTLLRIKAVNFRITDELNLPLNPLTATQKGAYSEMDVSWHLSTSEKAYRISLADTNIVASAIQYYLADHVQDVWLDIFSGGDLNPTDWEDGFIAATDTLWLTFLTENFDEAAGGMKLSVQIECESVKVTKAQALAIAVAQATSTG